MKVFEIGEINNLTLANRFVRSATWEGMAASDGSPTPALIGKMEELTKGGVGLIITSHAYVSPEGQAVAGQLGVHRDKLIPALQLMSEAVHKLGGKIVMQISHAGCFASQKSTGRERFVVSDDGKPGGHVITPQDIGNITAAFAAGARRAQAAGFDGVQLHSAHGYLLSQFLSPVFNHRDDEYGGEIKKRARIVREVVQAVRNAVGPDYPVLIKLNCQDFVENGLTLEDSLQVGAMLAQAGVDGIELSGGLLTSVKLSPSRPAKPSAPEEPYYLNEAREFKKQINIPLILVGGIRSLAMSESIVQNGLADYIAMSRPFIKDPDLINRWQAGENLISACKSDNRCFRTGFSGNGISCDTKDS